MWGFLAICSSPFSPFLLMKAPFPFFNAQRIGILSGREAIGDGLIKIPFLRALRAGWPTASIHWITTQGDTVYTTDLKETVAPLLDAVFVQPAWLGEKSGTAPTFDLVIDTRGRWKPVLAARKLLRSPLFITPALGFLLSDRRPPFFAPRPSSLIGQLLQLVELAAGRALKATGRLPVPPALLAKAESLLPKGQTCVGLAPGAGGALKRWPLENFAAIAREQAAKGRVPVFLLGPQDLEFYDPLLNTAPEALFPLQARDAWEDSAITVEQTLALGRCLAAAVVNDSGTSHILTAVGCPLVRLFGPTRADKFAHNEDPLSHNVVIRSQAFGSDAMAAIPPQAVSQGLDRLLDGLV